jgi:Domain of unknown function (DUF4160)
VLNSNRSCHTSEDNQLGMSPRWATVAGHGLYFYFEERHRRPHVAVRGPEGAANVDIDTGVCLAGHLPPGVLRAVRELLKKHHAEALDAFRAALDHRPFDRLDQ